eukprot:TRINITY_DN56090_c0_g1_i1.p1 TRINITY_DN56090_c0_g1~~TRINITY_DN56090_c0_g1_i1.p1  ORF type:complete len:361 (-),score=54.52 TRINITY_DN56090_c0_g1_i1:194-1216(-)
MDAGALIAYLHGRLVRALTVSEGIHFHGLQQAAASLRRSGKLHNKWCKKLTQVDLCFSLCRHVTEVSGDTMFNDIIFALRPQAAAKLSHDHRHHQQGEEAVDFKISTTREEVVYAPKVTQHESLSHIPVENDPQRHFGEVEEVTAPMKKEEMCLVPKILPLERVQHGSVEVKETLHVPKVIPQERIQDKYVEEVDAHMPTTTVVSSQVPRISRIVAYAPTAFQQERHHHILAEQIVDTHAPQKGIQPHPAAAIVEIPLPVLQDDGQKVVESDEEAKVESGKTEMADTAIVIREIASGRRQGVEQHEVEPDGVSRVGKGARVCHSSGRNGFRQRSCAQPCG